MRHLVLLITDRHRINFRVPNTSGTRAPERIIDKERIPFLAVLGVPGGQKAEREQRNAAPRFISLHRSWGTSLLITSAGWFASAMYAGQRAKDIFRCYLICARCTHTLLLLLPLFLASW